MSELPVDLGALDRDGFLLVPAVYPPDAVGHVLALLAGSLAGPGAEESVRSQAGTVYAARNLLAVCPWAAEVWRVPPLPALLAELLGADYGLVRGLYFDKPPERTWALPLHKDLTVAVRDARLPSRQFTKPTRKAGVPHAEAPAELLERMVTLRLHLDDMTDENGPLQVVPGSHRTGKVLALGNVPPRTLRAAQGDVLLMRPLLVHGSSASRPGTRLHRRVLHLEFAGLRELPDGYAWHDFIPA